MEENERGSLKTLVVDFHRICYALFLLHEHFVFIDLYSSGSQGAV